VEPSGRLTGKLADERPKDRRRPQGRDHGREDGGAEAAVTANGLNWTGLNKPVVDLVFDNCC